MRLKTALLTAAVILFGSCLFGCAQDDFSDMPENTEAQAYSLSSTNLDGISVYSSISSVSIIHVLLAHRPFGCGYYVFSREAELLKEYARGGGGSEVVYGDGLAVQPDIFVPAHGTARF